MKVLLCTVALLVAASAVPAEEQFYQSKFDLNLGDVLRSDRLLRNYYNCLMDKGNCTPQAQELKQILPEALQTKCKRCSPQQEEEVMKAVKFLSENKPGMWKALEKKYDPTGKLRTAIKTEPRFKKYNLKI